MCLILVEIVVWIFFPRNDLYYIDCYATQRSVTRCDKFFHTWIWPFWFGSRVHVEQSHFRRDFNMTQFCSGWPPISSGLAQCFMCAKTCRTVLLILVLLMRKFANSLPLNIFYYYRPHTQVHQNICYHSNKIRHNLGKFYSKIIITLAGSVFGFFFFTLCLLYSLSIGSFLV